MPLPTLKKTWQFNHYVGTPSGISPDRDQANQFVAVKNALKSFGSSPWTVVGSSDGTTGALDGVDRWTSGTLIDTNRGHAWIVLEQAGWNGGGQVCWQWNGGAVIWFFSSPLGTFSGGSATARPTATDEQNISINGGLVQPYSGLSGVFTCHTLMSTDGQCTRLFLGANNQFVNSYVWETWDQPTGGIDNNVFSTSAVWHPFLDLRDLPICMTNNAGQAILGASNSIQVALEGYSQNSIEISGFNGANEISGQFPFWDYTFICSAQRDNAPPLPPRAVYGRVFDMWYTAGNISLGDGFPSNGSKQFMSFVSNQNGSATTVLPWDGTVLVMG